MRLEFRPSGVCSRQINIEADDGIITNVEFIGGCNGNAKGISSLVKGMRIDDVIERLKGTTCGYKKTSCPDQLAVALEKIQNK